MELFEASHQWASRPDDERFATLEDMRDACKAYAASAAVATVPFSSIRVEADQSDVKLYGKTGVPAKLTYHAFGQLCATASCPPGFVRELPATLASQVINHRMKEKQSGDDRRDRLVLFHKNGDLVARAITSDVYDRVWNHEIIERGLIPMQQEGWRVPPARPARPDQKGTRLATEADILPNQADFGLAVKVGDPIAPAGLYASDHDMFAFLVDPRRAVTAGDRGLMRGIFCRNSEVGDGSLVLKSFLLDNVCGNHIVWGARDVVEVRIAHIAKEEGKTLAKAAAKFAVMLKQYDNASASDDEALIAKAMRKEIAASRDEVIDAVFKFAKLRSLGSLNLANVTAACTIAEAHESWYGNPRSVWGVVSGLTELSQSTTYADDRNHMDTQAARVMEMAF